MGGSHYPVPISVRDCQQTPSLVYCMSASLFPLHHPKVEEKIYIPCISSPPHTRTFFPCLEELRVCPKFLIPTHTCHCEGMQSYSSSFTLPTLPMINCYSPAPPTPSPIPVTPFCCHCRGSMCLPTLLSTHIPSAFFLPCLCHSGC